MIGKINEFIQIVLLLSYSLVMYIYKYVSETIYKNNRYQEAEAEEEEKAEAEAEELESFTSGNANVNNTANNNIEQITPIKLYRENEYLPKNAGDYNTYSIEKIYPDNYVLPENYVLQTEKYETKNTDYDYVNYSNLDGAGVHLKGNWEQLDGVNRPWFETCLSPMNCAIAPGKLEKFNYNL